jgi:hypothetical protein
MMEAMGTTNSVPARSLAGWRPGTPPRVMGRTDLTEPEPGSYGHAATEPTTEVALTVAAAGAVPSLTAKAALA